MILSSIVNTGYVKTTSSFTYELYDITTGYSYKIAHSTTTMTLSDFTVGTVSSLTVVPVDSYETETVTTFTVAFTPSHDLLAANKITIDFPSSIVLTD